jgi:hypothetical protein
VWTFVFVDGDRTIFLQNEGNLKLTMHVKNKNVKFKAFTKEWEDKV